MRALTLENILAVTGGRLCGAPFAGEVTAVTTDSRNILPGCLFAALKGEKVDGHDFAAASADKGAAVCLLEREVESVPCAVIVESVFRALQLLAAFYREQFAVPFVGITGSVGKTTAKEMIAAVLSRKGATMRTDRNFNNELGVPLTLFSLREEHHAAVVEMGISDFGEMRRLTAMVQPDIAVFTVIGDSHLEFLHDRVGVLRAKSEMLECVRPDGTVIVNGDDEYLRGMNCKQKKITFGLSADCDVRAENVENQGISGLKCDICTENRRIAVTIPAFGDHMIYAALEGAAVGIALGLPDAEIASGIADYKTVGRRARIVECAGITVIDDCYNANPTSVLSALHSMERLCGRKIAVLGDMLELGENPAALHYETGLTAGKCCEKLFACGEVSRETVRGAVDAGCTAGWFESSDALTEALLGEIRDGDIVLVKASHGMHFETIVEALSQR